ncbi:MAG: colicin immunity domain-containing protein, partial [Bacteroidota bacterium]
LNMRAINKHILDKYISIIKKFTDGEMKASDFERRYIEMFKSEVELQGRLFDVLNQLFSDVDAYCGNPEIANYNKEDPFHDIDENELLSQAKYSLRELQEMDKT